jgi:hypothetical protein
LTKKAKKTNSKNSQIHTGVLVLENKKVFKGIGIGYVQSSFAKMDTEIYIDIRNTLVKAKVVKFPFK